MFNAYFALLTLPFIKKRTSIWLIGGHNAKLYTDNAKVFYEYILEYHPHINIYWITDKDAPAFKQIKGRKLIKGSIKSYQYFYQAKIVLFSDTLNSDIAPLSFILPVVKHFYMRTFKVYLSHGTIAFKRMPQHTGKIGEIKKAIFNSYNLAIASTELSKTAMIGYNIKPSSIVLAGSARHDALEPLYSSQRSILIAPTWRGWLTDLDSLKKSAFFRHYSILISNKKLHLYLRQNDIIIHFYLHHMFHKYWKTFQTFENDVIKILPPHAKVNVEIMSAELMITDYSSMCSDFYYLRKPVLFFQFDREEFIKHIDSEIDLRNDTFGEVFIDSNPLIEHLIETVKQGNIISKKQKEGEKYFIHFTDKQNCTRIYDTIIKRSLQRSAI